jgi:hypothetical protein
MLKNILVRDNSKPGWANPFRRLDGRVAFIYAGFGLAFSGNTRHAPSVGISPAGQ